MKQNHLKWVLLSAVSVFLLGSNMAAASMAENPSASQSTQNQVGKAVTVTVTDAVGPVPGADVFVKGTTNGAITDAAGKASLKNVPSNATLVVSFTGYVSQEIQVNGQSAINVTLVEDAQALDELVVVGYGTVFKKKTTSAIATVNADKIAAVPVSNITQTLAGQAPGLVVTQSGGLDSKASISIRGGGTPLYVIDNVVCAQRDFQNINPADIESMSILKDASSTAIYGARAANGIIIVTTKHGKDGKVNVDYSFNTTLTQPVSLAEHTDSYTYALAENAARASDGVADRWTAEDLKLFQDGSDPQYHANTDWYKECLRNFAPERRHNISISGGNGKIRAFSAFGYNSQESIYNTDSHTNDRYTFRTNVDANFDKIGLKVSTSLDAYMLDYRTPAATTGTGYFYVFSHLNNHTAMEIARNKYGQPYGMTVDNPVVEISDIGGYTKQKTYNVRSGMNIEWNVPWIKGLKFNAIGSFELYTYRYKNWQYSAYTYDWDGNLKGADLPKLSKSTAYTESYNVQTLGDYTRTFGGHTISLTAGFEASGNQYDNTSVSRQSYVIAVDQLNSGPSSTMQNSSSEGIGERRASVIGRLRYDYKSKYMLEANLRYDGSDYFPADHRWGLFFSGSLAYAISEENFWKNSFLNNIFDTFKLRASYGEIGLDDVTRYAYISSYNLSTQGAYIDDAWYATFSEGSLPATAITWYKTKDFNVGLDYSTLNNRLSGSLDYFAKVTTGYLASPSNVGYTSPLGKSLPQVVSDGEKIRRGFDLDIHWKDRIGDFSYGISGNFTLFDDRWNINPNESETSVKNPYKRQTQIGNYTGTYYHCLGYYTSLEDIMNSPKTNSSSNIMAGDQKYEDFNGDGKIDSDDMTRCGRGSSPRNMFGLGFDMSYKAVFFNLLLQGATNFDAYLADSRYGSMNFVCTNDTWTPDNTDAKFPRRHYMYGYSLSSDARIVKSDYLRVKNVAIGYDFKQSVLSNAKWLSKLALSVSAYNLFTFSPVTKYGFDPEYNNSNGYAYPVTRSFSLNLNVGF